MECILLHPGDYHGGVGRYLAGVAERVAKGDDRIRKAFKREERKIMNNLGHGFAETPDLTGRGATRRASK